VRRIAFALLNRLPGTCYRAKAGTSIDSRTGLPKVVVHKGSGCEMVLVPAGTFMRGASPTDAKAEPRERPQERLPVARPFYLGRFELTYGKRKTTTSSRLQDRHAIRGGAFNYGPDWGRASARWRCEPHAHSDHIGFRVALDP